MPVMAIDLIVTRAVSEFVPFSAFEIFTRGFDRR